MGQQRLGALEVIFPNEPDERERDDVTWHRAWRIRVERWHSPDGYFVTRSFAQHHAAGEISVPGEYIVDVDESIATESARIHAYAYVDHFIKQAQVGDDSELRKLSTAEHQGFLSALANFGHDPDDYRVSISSAMPGTRGHAIDRDVEVFRRSNGRAAIYDAAQNPDWHTEFESALRAGRFN
jgi:hypothetical protein